MSPFGHRAAGGVDPSRLAWHYTDGAGLISILTGHALWATSSAFLNDQQEVALGGRLIAERMRELADEDPNGPLRELADLVGESTGRGHGPGPADCYILSASLSHDSLAMWRLYGGSKESYAIGLDPTEPLAVLGPPGTVAPKRGDGLYLGHQTWQPVAYTREEQLRLVDPVLRAMPDRLARIKGLIRMDPNTSTDSGRLPTDELGVELETFLDALQQALLLIKHEGFVDERETRYSVVLVSGGPGSDAQSALEAPYLSYRATTYGIAPFVRLTGCAGTTTDDAVTDTPTRLPIRAVSVSPSPNGDEATGSLRRLLISHGYDVPVLRSSIPFRD